MNRRENPSTWIRSERHHRARRTRHEPRNLPLKQAEDAVLVDSSEMGIDDVVNAILNVYKKGAE